jgi:hypothetical protein
MCELEEKMAGRERDRDGNFLRLSSISRQMLTRMSLLLQGFGRIGLPLNKDATVNHGCYG